MAKYAHFFTCVVIAATDPRNCDFPQKQINIDKET